MTSTARPAPTTRNRVQRWHVVRVRGRVVGVVKPWGPLGELALVRIVQGRRHQLQRPPAWTVAVEALEAARAAGTERVVILDRGQPPTEWWADLSDFERQGFAMNYGYGQQVGLGLEWWSRRPLRAEEVVELERAR